MIGRQFRHYSNFAISGLCGFVAEYTILSLLHHGLALGILLSKGLGYAAGIVTTYIYNRFITFANRTTTKKTKELPIYVVGALCGAAINNAAFFLLMSATPKVVGQIFLCMVLASGLAMFFNYFFYRQYVFTERQTEKT